MKTKNIFKEAKNAKETNQQPANPVLPGIRRLAVLAKIEKYVKAAREAQTKILNGQLMTLFVNRGLVLARRPDNFTATDDRASASCQLKIRSTALREDEADLLDSYGIPYSTAGSEEETFRINPAYADDQELLRKVSAALMKLKGFPIDFIEVSEAKSVRKVTEDTLNSIFQLNRDPDITEELLKVVSTVAMNPKVECDSKEMLDVLGPELITE